MNNTNNASHQVSSFNPSLPSVESLNRALERESRSTGYKPIRLIDTKTLSRDAWLGVRNKGIGSSDAAAAVGRKRCQRRAAIEPIIGHLKSDFRLSRNFLKGIIGDHINAMMAAAAGNFSLWMRLFLAFLFSFNPGQLNNHPLLGTNRRVIA
jgi:hypothetical protein